MKDYRRSLVRSTPAVAGPRSIDGDSRMKSSRSLRETGLKNLSQPLAPVLLVRITMRGQNFAHLIANAHRRMERESRLLIDQRDAPTANALELTRFRLKNISPLEQDLAFLNFSIWGKKAQERRAQRALSGSRFPEHAQDFAESQAKTHAHKGGRSETCARNIRDTKILYF
jgi:hypothetical protein